MKCYNCGQIEDVVRRGKELISDIERIETDLKGYSDEEEKFMPLCQKCFRDWQNGKLKDIEEKWIAEKNKGGICLSRKLSKCARMVNSFSKTYQKKRCVWVAVA